MTMQETVAANIRARLAWYQVKHEDAAKAAGCSMRSFAYKISGEYGFRPNELAGLAGLFRMDDIGAFYRVPDGFVTWESVSACTGIPQLRRHLALIGRAA